MVTVVFYMKGKPKDSRQFATYQEAQAFMQALKLSDDCESVSILRG
jgi:hypothetical protein